MGLDFPNLPYLIDGEVKLTQSIAIMRYLGRKFGLSPSEANIAKADNFEQVVFDLRMGVAKIAYSNSDEYGELRTDFLRKLPKKLEEIATFIGAGPFALGDRITYIDFLAVEYLGVVAHFSPKDVAGGPIAEYIQRIKSLPPLKKFFESEDCTHNFYSIFAPIGSWPGWPNK
ncbi:hypothetical protein ACHWQZ_G007070 [Mnemiopsis leidyi]